MYIIQDIPLMQLGGRERGYQWSWGELIDEMVDKYPTYRKGRIG